MLEKPRLPEEKIIACFRETYGLTITAIEFLPLGYDHYAGVYRVTADDGRDYFLKVKQETVSAASVGLPRYLKDQGIEQVVAPLPTVTGQLWAQVDDFALILYPFIVSQVGVEVGLSDSQWIEFGAVLKRIHTMPLSAELLEQVRSEDFVPDRRWTPIVNQLQADIPQRDYTNPVERELAAFWRERHEAIGQIVEKAEALGRLLQERPTEFVLCHADIHTANLLLTPDGKLFVVDWDQPVLAPKEQDLMFMIGGFFWLGAREEALFFQGYGKDDVDWLALAYYRYERIVEDIGGFGEHVFLIDGVGDEAKQESVQWFRSMFEPRNVVEVAHELDYLLPASLRS